jgi:hypothetical protein
MFKLIPDPIFTATVLIPNGDEPIPLKLKFIRKGKEDVSSWIEAAAARSDTDSLTEIIDGWIDVDTPYTVSALEKMLNNYSGAGMAMFKGYLNALSEAARKN